MANRVLSDHERAYITRGVQEDLRSDGRSCRDYRHFELRTGVVSNTSGSAEIKLERTSITIGVKAEIGPPRPSLPNCGRIEFFVDCSALASPEFEGRQGDDLGQHLAHRLTEIYSYSQCIDLTSLSIIDGQQCWILYVDALVLEWSGGVLDCLSIAVKAALSNTKYIMSSILIDTNEYLVCPRLSWELCLTRIPKLQVTGEGDEMEIDVSDNPFDATPIDTSNIPVIVTLSSIGGKFVVDASHEEEACSTCQLSVAVDAKGKLCGILKEGTGSIPYKQYTPAITLANEVASSVLERVEHVTLQNVPMIH